MQNLDYISQVEKLQAKVDGTLFFIGNLDWQPF